VKNYVISGNFLVDKMGFVPPKEKFIQFVVVLYGAAGWFDADGEEA
jgi:hypothetical protein